MWISMLTVYERRCSLISQHSCISNCYEEALVIFKLNCTSASTQHIYVYLTWRRTAVHICHLWVNHMTGIESLHWRSRFPALYNEPYPSDLIASKVAGTAQRILWFEFRPQDYVHFSLPCNVAPFNLLCKIVPFNLPCNVAPFNFPCNSHIQPSCLQIQQREQMWWAWF